MSISLWENELKQWIQKSRYIDNALTSACEQFFTLAFQYNQCPERAWFGTHSSFASLVVGGIFLAAIGKSGKDRGIWLLIMEEYKCKGWETWRVLSTSKSHMPLAWLYTSDIERVVDILDNAKVWRLHRLASSAILEFPIASDRDIFQEKRKKKRLSTLYPSVETKSFRALADVGSTPFLDRGNACSSVSDAVIVETERETVVQSRVGQERFRAELLQYWHGCSVTGCNNTSMLRASHIKPWSESTDAERLDKFNGLLLIPTLDTALDNGYISFTDSGQIMISPALSESDRVKLGIHPHLCIHGLTEYHRPYLLYHRERKFVLGQSAQT